jgi:hypothetical protein
MRAKAPAPGLVVVLGEEINMPSLSISQPNALWFASLTMTAFFVIPTFTVSLISLLSTTPPFLSSLLMRIFSNH